VTSVWDYPRPPRLEDFSGRIQVVFNGVVIAETRRAKRVLETSHPPTYYIPLQDIRMEYLDESARTSFCEWKGLTHYFTVRVGEKSAEDAAWFYTEPDPAYADLKDHAAFYPGLMDACYVNGEKVRPQPGRFYGGWITKDIEGPFKGDPGTEFW
jgi:uncharacterized protein (DUF427 family)